MLPTVKIYGIWGWMGRTNPIIDDKLVITWLSTLKSVIFFSKVFCIGN